MNVLLPATSSSMTSGSVMVWEGIFFEGLTDLHLLVNGTFTAVRYQDEILTDIVRSYAGAVGPGFVLAMAMPDLMWPECVGSFWMTKALMPSSHSPDLNPEPLGHCVLEHPKPPSSTTHCPGASAERLFANCSLLLIPNYMTKNVVSNIIHYIKHFR